MAVHDCVPVFANEHYEDWSEGHVKVIKVLPWGNTFFARKTCEQAIVLCKLDLLPVKFHSKKGKNEHNNRKKDQEESNFFHGECYAVKKLPEACPASSKLEYTQEPNASKGRKSSTRADAYLRNLSEHEVN